MLNCVASEEPGCGEGDREGRGGGEGVLVRAGLKHVFKTLLLSGLGTDVKVAFFLSEEELAFGAIPNIENILSLREVSTISSSAVSSSFSSTLWIFVSATRFFFGELGWSDTSLVDWVSPLT